MTGPRTALDGWRPIVGTAREVAAEVRAARAAGHCEAMTLPEYLSGGRVRVYVRIQGAQQLPARPRARRWPIMVALAGGAGMVVLAVLAAAWALDHWRQLLGAGIVALVVLAALGRRR